MDRLDIKQRLIDAFDTMSPQLQKAARYVIDYPQDVALLSMRELAKNADVQPATMTRMAKYIGLTGFDTINSSYTTALRDGHLGFAGHVDSQLAKQKMHGDKGIADEMFWQLSAHLDDLKSKANLKNIVTIAKKLAKAQKIYCLGMRSSHAMAWYFHYIVTLIGKKSINIDGVGGTAIDSLAKINKKDILLVVSVEPYAQMTIDIVEFAHSKSIPIIAITDSEVSPLAKMAEDSVIVATKSSSFFHTMTPVFAVVEVLSTLVAGHMGDKALHNIQRFDACMAFFNTHFSSDYDRL